MNGKMSQLLRSKGIVWPLTAELRGREIPKLRFVHDCLLLEEEYERNRHARISDFPDRTGFECFINHVHLPFAGTRESLARCLEYAAALQHAVASVAKGGHRVRVVVGIGDCDCVVRFHLIRPGETWLSENLEDYESEAMLVFDVPS